MEDKWFLIIGAMAMTFVACFFIGLMYVTHTERMEQIKHDCGQRKN